MVNPTPTIGMLGHPVNFCHPKFTENILIELCDVGFESRNLKNRSGMVESGDLGDSAFFSRFVFPDLNNEWLAQFSICGKFLILHFQDGADR